MKILDEALEKLKELGSTQKEIVRTLHMLGVKGIKGSFSSCPLAKYLQHALNNNLIYITPYSIKYLEERIDLKSPFNNFVECFDAGLYPYLEEVN